jgi:DNA-binding response OmpR family regulator
MFNRPRILLVDSDLHALSRLYLFLLHKEYKVEAAEDAAEIIARVERFRPSLLIVHARSRNLTAGICQYLNRKRFPVAVIGAEHFPLPDTLKRLEAVPEGAELGGLEKKIREWLVIE